jgi:type IV pilus assembly protein PilO
VAAAKKNSLTKVSLPVKLVLGVVFAALPALSYYLMFHIDIESEIESAKGRHSKLQEELTVAKKAEELYRQDVEELNRRERNRAELVKVLPEQAEYHAFLSSVQSVANLVGVELVAWTPKEEVPEQFYSRVPMLLELRGRFHQLAKFFYNMGNAERIINMENISLKKPELKDSEVYLSVSVLATAFHAHAAESAAPEGGAQSRRQR